jgi:ribonuclease HII
MIPKNSPSFHFEKETGCQKVAGIDEAGCGPWAGPVVAAAVVIDPWHLGEDLSQLINDSKKMSHEKRVRAFDLLTSTRAISYGIGMASVEEIDTLNIAEATKLAMMRAFEALPYKPQHALIDGIRKPKLSVPATLIKKGDALSFSIAAASIVAKVTRDDVMDRLHQEFPNYGWDSNKGYGTQRHAEALQRWGITCHHRRSFAPIRALSEGL